MEAPQARRARPAWKEPMVWLVAAIPLASVLASVALLVAAARSSGNDDAVADRVRRTAQIQVADLAPDLAARELGLGARLRVDGDRIELLPTSGTFRRDDALWLELHHPARAQDDMRIALRPAARGWTARRPLPPGHDWNLILAPADGRWRLQGRLQGRLLRGEATAALRPALAAR